MEKTYIADPIPFHIRYFKKLILFATIIIFSIFIVLNIPNFHIAYQTILSILVLFTVLFVAYKLSKHHYHKVNIINDTIYFHGYNTNQLVESSENIKSVKIYQKVQSNKSGHKAYQLVFKTDKKSYYINEYYNWDDEFIIALFEDFKRAKGEQITLDERIRFKLTKY